MNNNERVDQWWLEACGYADEEIHEGMGRRYVNPVTQAGTNLGPIPIPRWNDPSAWTPKLFQKIEDAGLAEAFTKKLFLDMGGKQLIYCPADAPDRIEWDGIFHLIKATPAQKTAALSRALQERAAEVKSEQQTKWHEDADGRKDLGEPGGYA